MTLKTKATKRKEAEERATNYTWENSKAKRLGKSTQAEWEENHSNYVKSFNKYYG